jgi:hypothetical protein
LSQNAQDREGGKGSALRSRTAQNKKAAKEEKKEAAGEWTGGEGKAKGEEYRKTKRARNKQKRGCGNGVKAID